MELDGPGIGTTAKNVASANESEFAVVEIIDTEIVDYGATAARGHERIQVDIFFEERWNIALRLVSVVSSHNAFFRHGVVWRPNAGQQQHPHIVQGECSEKHQTGRLLEFTPLRVRVIHASRFFTGTV